MAAPGLDGLHQALDEQHPPRRRRWSYRDQVYVLGSAELVLGAVYGAGALWVGDQGLATAWTLTAVLGMLAAAVGVHLLLGRRLRRIGHRLDVLAGAFASALEVSRQRILEAVGRRL